MTEFVRATAVPVRILGIDPSVRSTGYGVIECVGRDAIRLVDAGVIAPNVRLSFSERLAEINDRMSKIIKAVRPNVIAVEEVFAMPVNPKTTIMMAHARGALLAAAAQARLEVVEFSATGVKRAVAGSGAASKEQVARMVVQLLRLSRVPRPADVTDALALALACANRNGRTIY